METRKALLMAFVTLGIGVAFGALLFSSSEGPPTAHASHETAPHEAHAPDFWTCSMHPQVKLPGAGLCPICHMELIPVTRDDTDAPFTLSKALRETAGIDTALVERKPAHATLELTGRLTVDETRVARVSSPAKGRVERLFVEVTGTRVKEGEHLLVLWSRDLYLVQKELVDALTRADQVPDGGAARRVLVDAAKAAEDRLTLFGMTATELQTLKRDRVAKDKLTLNAPKGGIVISRDVLPGQYVDEGTPLYTVADLSHVWVDIDVFESDLALVAQGQRVLIEPFGVAGTTREARVVLVSPVVDEVRRAVRVRADLPNNDGALKPGMLVRARIESSVDATGHVVGHTHDGAWTCSMHPEVSRTRAGTCPVCGMPLERRPVKSETGIDPLVIPVDAPLLTGRRAVVYVEQASGDGTAYDGREVKLGPRTDAGYVVLSGLREGERVVTRGAFKIDAAMQIEARPSMLHPEGLTRLPDEERSTTPADSIGTKASTATAGATVARGSTGDANHSGYSAVVFAYLDLESALTNDDHGRARAAAFSLAELSDRKMPAAAARERATVKAHAKSIADSADIKSARVPFVSLSETFIALVEAVGVPGTAPLYVQFCPMANEHQGARWLDREQAISNPYFGAKMLRCGETRATLAPAGGAP